MLNFIFKIHNYASHKLSVFLLEIKKNFKKFGRSRRIESYLKNHEIKKLHIGCGFNFSEGWLPTDLNPKRNVIFLDAKETFPFSDSSFDYIYCEHMIEHINYLDAKKMLSECNRILKPNGKIRISTPDLDKYLNLIYEPKDNKKIIDFYINTLFEGDYPNNLNSPYHILNLEMHSWGHQYLYNQTTLTEQLVTNDFKEVEFKRTGESNDPHLRNIELHGNNYERVKNDPTQKSFFEFETMIAEATK